MGAQTDATLFLGLTQSVRTGRVIEPSTTSSGRSRTVPLLSLAFSSDCGAPWMDPKALLFPSNHCGHLRAASSPHAPASDLRRDGAGRLRGPSEPHKVFIVTLDT